jgi:hypothetical protein
MVRQPHAAHVRPGASGGGCATKSAWKSKNDFYENTASFPRSFNVFTSLRYQLDVKQER